MSDVLSIVYSTIGSLFNFVTPIGLSFGAIVVGVFGAPLIVHAFRKFF